MPNFPLQPLSFTLEEVNGPSAARRMSELHKECFETGWSINSLEGLLALPGIWGYIANNSQEDLGFILTSHAADQAEILSVCVKDNFRRMGIARKLLNSTIKKIINMHTKSLFLEVNRNSLSVILLYKSVGFVEVGIRKNYYKIASKSHQDALIYQLLID